jgi:hypothetical protein
VGGPAGGSERDSIRTVGAREHLLNGAILGMSRGESGRFDEIVAFFGSRFLDTL